MQKSDLKAQLVTFITEGSPESLAEAMILAGTAVIDPAPGVEVGAATTEGSRDETHDSIDPHTGTLTDEAIAKRAARNTADRAADDVAAAEEAVAQAKVDKDKDALAQAQDELKAAQDRKTAADAAVAGDAAPPEGSVTTTGPGGETVTAPDGTVFSTGPVGGSDKINGVAGGAMIMADPNDPAITGGSSNIPTTPGVINTSKDLGA